MLETVEVTIDDREWPRMSLIVKQGTRVQKSEALYDVASTKFTVIVQNFLSTAIDRAIQRRKGNGPTQR